MATPENHTNKKWYTQHSEREDAEAVPDEEKVTYEACCHCKAVQYTARLPSLTGDHPHNVSVCTCSICTKSGYLFVYVAEKNFKLVCGEEALRSYSFGSKRLAHCFCGTCGTSLFIKLVTGTQSRTEPRVCCSVRNFRGVDLDALNYIYADGKNLVAPEINDETW